MSVSPAFMPDAAHPAPEPFGYRPLSAIAAASAGGVPQKRIGRVLSEVSPDLIALHGRDKVHGAISVHTIGLDEFGHAHLLVPALYPDHAGSMEPASCFAAVEQFDPDPAQACGPWTDVYALCAVICSLVSGSPPPHALARRVQDSYVPLAMRKPRGYEEAFLAAIDLGLSLAPAQRPQSVQALCEMLEVSCVPEADEAPVESRQAAAPSMGGRPMEQAGGARRRRTGSMLAVAAGVLVVAGVWAWLGRDDIPDDDPSEPVVVASLSASGRVAPPPYAARTPEKSPDAANSLASSVYPFTAEPDAGRSARPDAGAIDRAAPAPSPSTSEPAWTEPSGNTSATRSGTQSGPQSEVQAGPRPGPESTAPAAPEAGAATVAPPARPARVTVKLDIRPWGEIFVDGVSRGVTPPMKILHLLAGRHTVIVRNADLPPYKLSIELKAGHPVTLHHIFR